MSPKVLNLIREALEANGEAVFGPEDIAAWPAGDFEEALGDGLLEKAAPADEVVCPGCEHACLEDVEFVYGEKPEDTRAYVVCGERDDIGRVPIPLDTLDRWAVNQQRLRPARRRRRKGDAPTPETRPRRLVRPLFKDSARRDRMLDELSKDAKHREAYKIVYDEWGDPHDELVRAIVSQTGLDIGSVSRISHMKRRMHAWAEKERPQKPAEDVDRAVDKIVEQLRSTYLGKVVSHDGWTELVGTREEPGEVRSEAYASLIEFPGDVKKARAAAQKHLDAWRHRRQRIDHRRDADGQLDLDDSD